MPREVVGMLRGGGNVGVVPLIEEKYSHDRNMSEVFLSRASAVAYFGGGKRRIRSATESATSA
jgi:hypothetical protein